MSHFNIAEDCKGGIYWITEIYRIHLISLCGGSIVVFEFTCKIDFIVREVKSMSSSLVTTKTIHERCKEKYSI